ncbi:MULTISPECIES: helix-turn-helix domain-containing protein [unclassified Cellulomonas]|uniref:helix-turn-helix transcriptional regulator n=1 Tax=unclassified Cellulomonas TaxID=2620175 RepID=UPI0024B782CA|nr:helix-turn-helix domain-containing protein [Cellulomonas sp. ES6]WHP17623.1 winged helix-turn-helix transcriptional regulator [Cellulomonas sp. ES6]
MGPTTPSLPAVPPGVAPVPGEHDLEAGTRRRVLDLIAADGPVSAAELAAELSLTAAAVRRHLATLEAEGQIGVHDGRGQVGPARRGRPAKRYVVTAEGQAALSQQYSELAAQALRFVAEIGGADAVRSFAERRVHELEQRHAGALAEAGDDPARRARVLAEALADDGFAATARPVPGGHAIQLCQGHCPVQDVASEFPELCEAEAHAFSRMLGVHVQRLATLARGGHVCTTNIPITPVRRPTATDPPAGTSGPPPGRPAAPPERPDATAPAAYTEGR